MIVWAENRTRKLAEILFKNLIFLLIIFDLISFLLGTADVFKSEISLRERQICPSSLNLINTVEYITVIMLGKSSILTIFFFVLVAEMHKLYFIKKLQLKMLNVQRDDDG